MNKKYKKNITLKLIKELFEKINNQLIKEETDEYKEDLLNFDINNKYNINNYPERCSGSGFLLYFDNSSNIIKTLPKEMLYLTLTLYDFRVPRELSDDDIESYLESMKKKYGQQTIEYDIPKGRINTKYVKNYLENALKELNEETNLDINAIKDISKIKEIRYRNLLIFAAEFNINEINKLKLKINRHTGKLEHSAIHFTTLDDIIRNTSINTFIVDIINSL